MSEKIDWSKAPEGASHYVIGWGFFKLDLAGWFICDDGEKVWRKTPYQSPDNFSWWGNAVERPSPSWIGEGLPPVGAVCEVNPDKSGWRKSVISYVGDGFIAWLQVGDLIVPEYGAFIDDCEFRPIRTPEQIAADERGAAIAALVEEMKAKRYALEDTDVSPSEIARHYAQAIYDAGLYRKP